MKSSRKRPALELARTVVGPSGAIAREDVAPGRVLAERYLLTSRLGEGGQGQVWLAEDRLAGVQVAVKIMGPGDDARVRREISLLRLLRLPGVARLTDEGVDGGVTFLVMDRVFGKPFPGRPTQVTWNDLAETTFLILETLARIHATGVVHRDLKPDNVLVQEDGRPTILDFGLATAGSPVFSGRLTLDDQIPGTPAYLAPEQIRGETPTPRTDLYSLALMLYEALAGRPAHDARDLGTLLRTRLTSRPRPLGEVAPELPSLVAEVVDRLLAIEPDERPRSALEVMGLLRGQRPVQAASLPWLGPSTAIDALTTAGLAGTSLDLVGRPGAGRTRCLETAALRLQESGREVLRAVRGVRAFASLNAFVEALDVSETTTFDELAAALRQALGEALAAGAVLVVDDADRIDPASAALIAACRTAGSVLRTLPKGAPTDGPSLVLSPLDEAALRGLFAGPDRLIHLPEDGARVLYARSEGLPARVAEEVAAWVRAGVARWDDGRLRVDRDVLDVLLAGLWTPVLPSPSEGSGQPPRPAHLDEWLAWLALFGGRADLGALTAASKEPRWKVEAELAELISQGLAQRMVDGRFEALAEPRSLDGWPAARRAAAHLAIAAALPMGTPGRVFHLIAGHRDSSSGNDAIAAEVLALGRRLAEEGHLRMAVAALSEGWRALRPSAPPAIAEAIMTLWVEIALVEGVKPPLDRVLYELCRIEPQTPHLTHLAELVRAALSISGFDAHALSVAEALPAFDDFALERRAWSIRVLAARRAPLAREQEVVARAAAWAEQTSDPLAKAELASFQGRLRYREGRFVEAASLQAEAAASSLWPPLRTNALLNRASALLEAFLFEQAMEAAQQALTLSETWRHSFHEARATWLQRSAAYRSEAKLEPDRALADAVALLDARDLEAVICLNEAAIAYRAEDSQEAKGLAQRAEAIWTALGQPWGAALAQALAIAVGGTTLGEAEQDALETHALACPVPGIGAQTLGLLRKALGSPRDVSKTVRDKLTQGVAEEHWHLRMDVLSMHEALSWAIRV